MICEICHKPKTTGFTRNIRESGIEFCSCFKLTDKAMKMNLSQSNFYIVTGKKLNKHNWNKYCESLKSGTAHKHAQ
jgi:hypothetical protein